MYIYVQVLSVHMCAYISICTMTEAEATESFRLEQQQRRGLCSCDFNMS